MRPFGGAKRTGPGAIFARLGLWVAAFALLAQSLVVAAPEMHARDARAAAAELTALLGPGIIVCTQDDGPHAPAAPDCHDQCPLCRLAADLATLDPPAPAGVATPLRLAEPALEFAAALQPKAHRFLGFSLARGPPSLT